MAAENGMRTIHRPRLKQVFSEGVRRVDGKRVPPSPEYHSWAAMWTRCTNNKTASYKYYGGRGIAICERWKQYRNFLDDMGRRPTLKHSIDRVDPNGNYEPGNCRWATVREQFKTQRVDHGLTVGSVTQLPCEWSSETGIPAMVIAGRLWRGWSNEKAVFRPLGRATNGMRRLDDSLISWTEVAHELALPWWTYCRLIARSRQRRQDGNRQPFRYGNAQTKVDFAEASALYAQGSPLPKLAALYGVSARAVGRFLEKHGVALRTVSERAAMRAFRSQRQA